MELNIFELQTLAQEFLNDYAVEDYEGDLPVIYGRIQAENVLLLVEEVDMLRDLVSKEARIERRIASLECVAGTTEFVVHSLPPQKLAFTKGSTVVNRDKTTEEFLRGHQYSAAADACSCHSHDPITDGDYAKHLADVLQKDGRVVQP